MRELESNDFCRTDPEPAIWARAQRVRDVARSRLLGHRFMAEGRRHLEGRSARRLLRPGVCVGTMLGALGDINDWVDIPVEPRCVLTDHVVDRIQVVRRDDERTASTVGSGHELAD